MFLKSIVFLTSVSAAASAPNAPPEPAHAVRDIAPRQTDNTLSQLLEFADELGLSACIPQALPLATSLPAIPSGLLNDDFFSQALSQTTLPISDVCKFSVTGTDGPKFTSFLPALHGWYEKHSSQVASLASACPSASSWVQTLDAFATCSQATALPASIVVTDTDTATGTGGIGISFTIQTETVISDTTTPTGTTTTAETTETTTSSTLSSSTSSSPSPSSSPSSSSSSSTSTAQSSSISVSQAQAPHETGFVVAAAAIAGFIGAIAAL